MEGRHQVELASRKFRIQELLKNVMGEWGDYRDMFKCPTFWWIPYDYRIHPDNLAAWSETQVRDVWTIRGTRLFCGDEPCACLSFAKPDKILAALNGASAADGMVINPDRWWHEQFQKAQKETAKLEAQTIYESDRRIAELEAEVDRLRESNKEPAPVTPGPIEDYRPWTDRDTA